MNDEVANNGISEIQCKCGYKGSPIVRENNMHITATCALCGGYLKHLPQGKKRRPRNSESKSDHCVQCLEDDPLLLHDDHRNGNNWQDEESNFRTLCVGCHIHKTKFGEVMPWTEAETKLDALFRWQQRENSHVQARITSEQIREAWLCGQIVTSMRQATCGISGHKNNRWAAIAPPPLTGDEAPLGLPVNCDDCGEALKWSSRGVAIGQFFYRKKNWELVKLLAMDNDYEWPDSDLGAAS